MLATTTSMEKNAKIWFKETGTLRNWSPHIPYLHSKPHSDKSISQTRKEKKPDISPTNSSVFRHDKRSTNNLAQMEKKMPGLAHRQLFLGGCSALKITFSKQIKTKHVQNISCHPKRDKKRTFKKKKKPQTHSGNTLNLRQMRAQKRYRKDIYSPPPKKNKAVNLKGLAL